jgi:ketosteroid isomerase-like protein
VSQGDVDFVNGLISASAGMDKQQLLGALPEFVAQLCDPDVEWIEDPQRADSRVYRGHEGVIDSWTQWLEQWDEYGWEVDRVVDCGDNVLVYAREHARGTSRGVRVDARIFMVWTIRDGEAPALPRVLTTSRRHWTLPVAPRLNP